MSVDTLFRRGGDPYSGLSDAVALLPSRALRVLATDILRHLVALDRAGRLDERVTDRSIADDLGWSERSVQRALHALHRVLGELGCAIIDRVRQHGRRVISFVRGLASSGTRPAPIVAPSALPLPEKKDKNTTTGEASSSSLQSTPEKTEGTVPPVDPELVARACRLIPGESGATPGNVADAVAVYGAEQVSHALDVVERLNRHAARDGRLPTYSWGKVLGILKNRKREGWEPPAPGTVPSTPVAARSEPLPHRAPAPRLTAEDVAALVAACQDPDPMTARMSRSQLRGGVKSGEIPADLVPTIPPSILDDS